MLSLGTPEVLAALSVAASVVFFAGSVDPPSFNQSMNNEARLKHNEIKHTACGNHDVLHVKGEL
jgi:hypothetical protein